MLGLSRARFFLFAMAICTLAASRPVLASSELLIRLTELLESKSIRFVLEETPAGQRVLQSVLGKQPTSWHAEQFIETLSSKPQGFSLRDQQELYRRLIFLRDRLSVEDPQNVYGLREGVASVLNYEFVTPRRSSLDLIRQAFRWGPRPKEVLLSSDVLPSQTLYLRIVDHSSQGDLFRRAIDGTATGRELTRRIALLRESRGGPYRSSGPTWDIALEILGAPEQDATVLEIGQRMYWLTSDMSGVHWNVGEPAMESMYFGTFERYFGLEPGLTAIQFKSARGGGMVPRRGSAWDLP